jgi:hypothetical protein
MTAAPSLFAAPDPETEKQVSHKIVQLLRACECPVYSTSQVRPSHVSEGISDLIAMSPKRGVAFIEVKRSGGKQRPQQVQFQADCEAAGGTYILADGVEVVRDWLAGTRKQETRNGE